LGDFYFDSMLYGFHHEREKLIPFVYSVFHPPVIISPSARVIFAKACKCWRVFHGAIILHPCPFICGEFAYLTISRISLMCTE